MCFHVTCPMKSSVCSALPPHIQIRKSHTSSSSYLPNTQSKRGLRRVRDSNPRGVAACLVSGEVHSSSLPTLQTTPASSGMIGAEPPRASRMAAAIQRKHEEQSTGHCQAPGTCVRLTIGLVTPSQYLCSYPVNRFFWKAQYIFQFVPRLRITSIVLVTSSK